MSADPRKLALDAIELAEKATAGPWKRFYRSKVIAVHCSEKTPVVNWQSFDDIDRPIKEHAANAAFIAASRALVPALAHKLLEALDELAREKAERKADAIAYEGALGNPIPIDHNGKLSNGENPKNFLAQFLREELDSLNGREPTQPLDKEEMP